MKKFSSGEYLYKIFVDLEKIKRNTPRDVMTVHIYISIFFSYPTTQTVLCAWIRRSIAIWKKHWRRIVEIPDETYANKVWMKYLFRLWMCIYKKTIPGLANEWYFLVQILRALLESRIANNINFRRKVNVIIRWFIFRHCIQV